MTCTAAGTGSVRLGCLINGMALRHFAGDPEMKIHGIAYDSREVQPGFLFVAIHGRQQDGHAFIDAGLKRGAVALVVENSVRTPPGVAVLQVPDSRAALSKLALRFYQPPLHSMNLIGVTGTNGKTTTTYLIEAILAAAGHPVGVIGTVNYRFADHVCPAAVTTPESLDLMRALRIMADGGVGDVALEVSSHALDQGRIRGIPFRIAVFTNLSRDHLDYHRNMNEYFQVKSHLFRTLGQQGAGPLSRAVINRDDPRGEELMDLTDVPIVTYGLGSACDLRAERVEATRDGLCAELVTPRGRIGIRSALIGEFNLYNILAATAAALCLNVPPAAVVAGIENLTSVPGRLETVPNQRGLDVVVDYAHTPDALQKAMETLRPLTAGRLITVFGCGGDRDPGKRHEMGAAAGQASDLVIITSDNPRSEDPEQIASQVEEGVRAAGLRGLTAEQWSGSEDKGYLRELDRRNAIFQAMRKARPGDFVLIAGKGHEDYQIVGERRRHFDDREIAAAAAAEAG